MKIRTGLSHEKNDGLTTVMFAKPELHYGKIYVPFAIIITTRNASSTFYSSEWFNYDLTKSQKKRVLSYAKSLTRELAAKVSLTIVGNGEINNIGHWNNCIFDCRLTYTDSDRIQMSLLASESLGFQDLV
jgi:hypothetical protein